jgi:hypothetical protein
VTRLTALPRHRRARPVGWASRPPDSATHCIRPTIRSACRIRGWPSRTPDEPARSDAPVASTLIVAYGHWLGACRAAWRFVDRPAHPPPRRGLHHLQATRDHRRDRSLSTAASANGRRGGSSQSGARSNAAPLAAPERLTRESRSPSRSTPRSERTRERSPPPNARTRAPRTPPDERRRPSPSAPVRGVRL